MYSVIPYKAKVTVIYTEIHKMYCVIPYKAKITVNILKYIKCIVSFPIIQ